MAKEQRFFGTSCELGPHASRRGFLQASLAIGTLALGQRAALGQSGGAHAHMPELGVTKLPVVPAMDQPLVEPEVRRSARCAQHQPALRLRYVHALLLPRGYAPLVYHTSNCLCARTEGSAEAGRIVLGDPMSEIVKLPPELGELGL